MGALGLPGPQQTKAAGLSAGFPDPFVWGHFRREHRARAPSGAWLAITGGRGAGAPGRSARALPGHRSEAPALRRAGPGARLLPGTRSQTRPPGPGGGQGRRTRPRGEQSPVHSHGEVQGWETASPTCPAGCPRVGSLRGEEGRFSGSCAKGRPVLSGPRRGCVHTLQSPLRGSHRVPNQGRTEDGLF